MKCVVFLCLLSDEAQNHVWEEQESDAIFILAKARQSKPSWAFANRMEATRLQFDVIIAICPEGRGMQWMVLPQGLHDPGFQIGDERRC